jgi:hypothetical protein
MYRLRSRGGLRHDMQAVPGDSSPRCEARFVVVRGRTSGNQTLHPILTQPSQPRRHVEHTAGPATEFWPAGVMVVPGARHPCTGDDRPP